MAFISAGNDVAPIESGFKTRQELVDAGQVFLVRPGEKSGFSVFVRDADAILHTGSDFGDTTGLLFLWHAVRRAGCVCHGRPGVWRCWWQDPAYRALFAPLTRIRTVVQYHRPG